MEGVASFKAVPKKAPVEYMKTQCLFGHDKMLKMHTFETTTYDIVELWCNRPKPELEEDCDVIKIHVFWPIMFETSTLELDGRRKWHPSCLNKKSLQKIEILEDVTELAKAICDIPCFIRGLLNIGRKIDERVVDVGQALEWVKSTGHIDVLLKLQMLGDECWPPLEVFFTEYQHYIEKASMNLSSLKEEFDDMMCEPCVQKSEVMKSRGNQDFSKDRFQSAIKWYTIAIDTYPENHLLYGNRALCYLRLNDFTRALADGKRATILKQRWSKGHYRFCDALFAVGECEHALAANMKAQKLCEKDPDGLKELVQQNLRFRKEIEEMKGGAPCILDQTYWETKSLSTVPTFSTLLYKIPVKEKCKKPPAASGNLKKMDIKDSATKSNMENTKLPSEPPAGPNRKSTCGESRSKSPEGKPKKKSKEPEKPRETEILKVDRDNKKSNSSTTPTKITLNGLPEMFKTLVHNGHTALLDQCFQSAEQAFSQLLDILDPADLKKLHLATIDYIVLIYGHANALLGIGKPEELIAAEQQFNKIIEKYTKQRFNCLAFYGIGNVHLRQNRFVEAINHFNKSQIMLNRKMVPGVLKWPTTAVVIEETRPEKLQILLEKCIEECKFPPEPDAICRFQQCHGHNKNQIYFTDPDFEGFVRVVCCHLCKVEFHIDCWKKLKAISYSDKNDKDFLEDTCFTPDCEGVICKIVIYCSTGLVKWQFEKKIMKAKGSRKPIVKQKSTSPRKLNLKQERKIRQKLLQKAKLNVAEVAPKHEHFSKEKYHKEKMKICIADPMLQQVIEHAELIKTCQCNTSLLISDLFLWCVINKEDQATYSASTTGSSQNEVMETLINLVTKKSNKVKMRLFLHVLNELHQVDGKLHIWLKEINNIGLKAAEDFFSCYGDCLQKLDLGSLRNLWNETYGNKLNSLITNSKVEVVTEYFRQASPEKTRCLIWLLEENKEKFQCPVLDQALASYFTIMDCPCVILKKQENQDDFNNGIKVKNKNSKKKQKETKSLLVLSGGVGTIAQEEDHIFTDENTLRFLDSNEPFVVPESIRNQVDEFESLYEDFPSSNAYLKLMDNKADITRESLYEYFFQILDTHGPLHLHDKLFVGEYKLFPSDARKIVEEAGGLKPFLLGSLRFFMIGSDRIGLLKHSLFLDTPEHILYQHWSLNPGAKEFKPVAEQFSTPISTSTTQSQAAPFFFTAGETAVSFADSIPLASVPTNHYMQAVPVMAPTSDIVVTPAVSFVAQSSDSVFQPFSINKSELGIPDYDVKPTFDGDGASETIPAGPIIAQAEFYERQNLQHRLNHDDPFLDTSSFASVNFVDSSVKMEKKGNPGKKRMVAVQVVIELSDHDVNTDPFHPFEKQQGDILRMEKEHQVLQEQLKEATEKYELSRSRNTNEITVVEEQLQKITNENKVSKVELDWFYQDLENEVKKWQQEKKEHQERLKAIKTNVKVLIEENETCIKNIDEKDQQYKALLNGFLESSNKFENEKMKFEENIKKGKDNILESVKRAVASEVSILENQKNIEIFKLCCALSGGQNSVGFLRSVGSSVPPSALPYFNSQIVSWDSYISSIEKEIENVVSQFDERISLVRSGAKLSSLQPVEVATLVSPPRLPLMQDKTSFEDPAIFMYSSPQTQLHNSVLPAFSSTNVQASVQSALNVQAGNNRDISTSSNPLNYASVEIPSVSVGRSPSKHTSVNQISQHGGTIQNINGSKSVSDVKPLTSQSVINSPTKKPYDKIIGHLNAIFPHYDGAELSNFVKEARSRNGSTFSGLDISEIVSRVTEFILDYQSKTSPHKETGMSTSSASMGQARSERKEVLTWAAANGSKANSQSAKQASQYIHPWKTAGEVSKSNWQHSKDSLSLDEDPCIICHEELRQNTIYVLECGHRFHKHCIKTWLNAQSTCPTCRVHVLLGEDFPVLTSRKRPT